MPLYIGTDMGRAQLLGCEGFAATVPPIYPTAVAPCVIVDMLFSPPAILEEPTDPVTVAAAVSSAQAAASIGMASLAAAASVQASNTMALQQRAQNALAANGSYLANPSVTQAQAVAQVAALTRQVNAIIRLDLRLVDTLGGT